MKKNKKINSSKNFLIGLFISVTLSLFIVMVTNLSIDPENLYSEKYKIFKNKTLNYDQIVNKIRGESLNLDVSENNLNRRKVSKAFSKHINEYDCVLLGSSQVMKISNLTDKKSLPITCGKVLNLSVEGAVLEDYIALSKHINFDNTKLKKIIISIHPWSLNMNRDIRWQIYKDDFNYVFKKLTNIEFNKDNYSLSLLKNLTSLKYFNESLKGFKNKNFVFIKDFQKPIINRDILLPDGSVINNQKELLSFNIKDSLKAANYKIQKNEYYDNSTIQIYQRYINFFGEKFEILFLHSPYSHEIWDNDELIVLKAIGEVEEKIKELAKLNKLKIIGSFDPRKINCKPDDFIDIFHSKFSCLTKIENVILKN